jgi:Intracellular proteinase inhibitor
MPELDPLPRPPRPPVLAPRTGDFAEVVTRARHRRRGRYGAAGASMAGLVAVVALAASHSGGTYGLEPAPPAATTVTGGDASPAPSPTASPADTTPPSATATAAPGDTTGDGTYGGSGGTPAPGEVTIDPGEPLPGAAAVRPVVVRDEIAYDATVVCDSDPSVVSATGWCLRYAGPTTAQQGVDQTYRVLACRHPGRGAATLTFPTEQQVEFSVYDYDRTEWHWSADYPFPKRQTSVTVGEARCARWSVHWDTTGDDGDPVAPGQYSLSPDVLASDWGDGVAMSYGTAIDLTITE